MAKKILRFSVLLFSLLFFGVLPCRGDGNTNTRQDRHAGLTQRPSQTFSEEPSGKRSPNVDSNLFGRSISPLADSLEADSTLKLIADSSAESTVDSSEESVASDARVDSLANQFSNEKASTTQFFNWPWWQLLGGGILVLGAMAFLIGLARMRQRESVTKSSTGEESFEIKLRSGRLHIGNAQHRGRRDEQQDAFGFSDPTQPALVDQNGLLAVVADGMGGMEGGAEASNTAVKAFLEAHASWSSEDSIAAWSQQAVRTVNQVVRRVARENEMSGKMGTTLSAVVVYNGVLYWMSVGDSRIYLWREGEFIQLTEDHVYARDLEKQVAAGGLSAQEAANHPERGALTSYLGLADLKHVDQNKRPLRLRDGDRVLICSDGLYGTLDEEQIAATMAADPQKAADALVKITIRADKNHQDNVTVMVLGYEEEETSSA